MSSAPRKKPLNMNSKSTASSNPHRTTKGVRQRGGNLRDKTTINRLNMYKGKAIRNKQGKIIGGSYMMKNRAGDVPIEAGTGRVAPDRRWFGNTRVVGQTDLDKFREEMKVRAADPYSVVLRRKKLPMGLLQEPTQVARMNLLETETYMDVFTGKRARKRPKLSEGVTDLAALAARAATTQETYVTSGKVDSNIEVEADGERDARSAPVFDKGQSKRIWAELYKVLDCSDVVLQVLDARNVPGTRCAHLEEHLRKNAPHKHLIFVVNKVDLVPQWVAKKWVQILSRERPTLAFHASITNSFGKGSLIGLLRQFGKLHSDKKQISVGVVGYPNVGKSSIINTLKKKKVCRVAPIPGETKVWQYITLMRRLFVIDCPGVVYDTGDSEIETVLKGVVRAERLPDPTEFIGAILERVKEQYVKRQYGVGGWSDADDFLAQVARKSGRLLPGGEPDCATVAVGVINDWQRGKLPFFVPPPLAEGETPETAAKLPEQKIQITSLKRDAKAEEEGNRVRFAAAAENEKANGGWIKAEGVDRNEERDSSAVESIASDLEEEDKEGGAFGSGGGGGSDVSGGEDLEVEVEVEAGEQQLEINDGSDGSDVAIEAEVEERLSESDEAAAQATSRSGGGAAARNKRARKAREVTVAAKAVVAASTRIGKGKRAVRAAAARRKGGPSAVLSVSAKEAVPEREEVEEAAAAAAAAKVAGGKRKRAVVAENLSWDDL